ncbi:MAG: hypothetical protein O2887_12690 [Bacteroidetes bacterium]|nr:hypothetical protein [Bacteroidota bacterium]MDA1121326.1 hypothetical protein [Bacteroidota bacterium]
MDKQKIKIDDLKKENIFKVPDRYFEELPSLIQARVLAQAGSKQGWFVLPSVRWAVIATPVLAVIMYFVIFRGPVEQTPVNIDAILAQVETNDLIAYLEDSDMTDAELISGLALESFEIDEITDELYLEDIDISDLESIDLLEDIDVSQELI